MRESSIQTGVEFYNLSEKAKELDKSLQSTAPGAAAHKKALAEAKTVVHQIVEIYPEFLGYLHQENGEYVNLTGSIERFSKIKLINLRSDLEDELREAQQARKEAFEARDSKWSLFLPTKLLWMNGIADNADREAQAHQASAKAIQKQIDALKGLSATDGKGAAPNLDHPDHAAKAAHGTAQAAYERWLAKEKQDWAQHQSDMIAIMDDGLDKQVAQINAKYSKMLEREKAFGADDATLKAIELKRDQDIEQAKTDAAQKQAEARKKLADQEDKKKRELLEKYGTAEQGFLDGVDTFTKRQGTVFQQWAHATEQVLQGLENAFSRGLQGILSGQMSFANGLKSIFQGISNAMSQMISQVIAKKMAGWMVDKGIAAWEKMRASQKAAEVATNIATGAVETTAEVTQSAVKTAAHTTEGTAGAWSAYGWIPWVGAALALAQIAQMNQSITGAAEGGWFDRPTMTVIGEGKRPELVVPDVAFKDFATNLSANILAQERAAQAYGHQANGYARARPAGGGGAEPYATYNLHFPGAQIWDRSDRGQQDFGNWAMDAIQLAARRRGQVLAPGTAGASF